MRVAPGSSNPRSVPFRCIRVNSPPSCTSSNVQDRRSWPSHSQLCTAPGAQRISTRSVFLFQQYTLDPGEKREWPVVFVIDPRLSGCHVTITCPAPFRVGGKTPAAPTTAAAAAHALTGGAEGRDMSHSDTKTRRRAPSARLFAAQHLQGGGMVADRAAQGANTRQTWAHQSTAHHRGRAGRHLRAGGLLVAVVNWVVWPWAQENTTTRSRVRS